MAKYSFRSRYVREDYSSSVKYLRLHVIRLDSLDVW